MDIEKLEKLSCLKIKEQDHQKIKESISDIWQMLGKLPNVEIINNQKNDKDKDIPMMLWDTKKHREEANVCYIERQKIREPKFSMETKMDGLKFDDSGLFEVVRVVHKKD